MRRPSYRYGIVILAALLWLLGASASATDELPHTSAPAPTSAQAHGVATSYPDLPYAAQHESRSATLEGVSLPYIGSAAALTEGCPPVRAQPPAAGARHTALRTVPLQQSCLPPPTH